MLFAIFVLFCLGSITQSSEGSNDVSRCAVVIFVNQSSFDSEADFSEYVENIRGLTANSNGVYFSENPDLFKVKHGSFIDAPGLFALESQKFPGKYLRRSNHTIVLEERQSNENFKNDATFLMDHAEKKETYTTLKLFSHRSWKLSTSPDSRAPLYFDDYKDNMTHSSPTELLVVAQPCPKTESPKQQVVNPTTKSRGPISGPKSGHISQHVTEKPLPPTDASLSGNADTKYLTAITNQGNIKTIPNEYSFNDYKVPDFIMNSLVENTKTAGDGVEAPKPDVKPAAVVHNTTPQQSIPERANKLPTTKQRIGDLSSLINDPDIDDLEKNLKNLQYGSKGCKLLVAEDTMEEDAASKDSVAHPKMKKECKDEFPESCVEMAKKGYCLAFKSLMSSVCRKSCNLCSRLLDTGFTSCTKTCGGGRQMRMIKINRREYLQTRRCNTHPCPINGGYSAFGPYTECSVTCGQGVKYRRRTCTQPKPQYNGKSCRKLGPSIDSRTCDAGPCPQKHEHKEKTIKKIIEKVKDSHHHKAALHIGGPHSDKVHEHSILLKGKKVANLRCTPNNGALRNIFKDSPTKRFIVHPVKNNSQNSKKSNIEDSEVLHGLSVGDTAGKVVRAFKSPYKIILARRGRNDMKLLEECVQTYDKLKDDSGIIDEHYERNHDYAMPDDKSYSEREHHPGNLIYTRPGEKSYSDFDEYKYETGNVVTPELTTSHDDNVFSSLPTGKLFGESKNFDDILRKMNAIQPHVNDQINQEQSLDNSLKMENAKHVGAMAFSTGAENSSENEDDMDLAQRAGFSVTTTRDTSPPSQDDSNTGKDSYGYNVETVPDR